MRPFDRTAPLLAWLILAWLLSPLAGISLAQTVTVDNSDPEFTILYGEWTSGAYGQPHGIDYNWAATTAYGADPAAVEWRPNLPQTGVYNVATWYVPGGNRADNAPFTIYHTGGSTPLTVNQQINGETWYALGAYAFNAGTSGYVTLHNSANPSVVIADAVRFTLETTTAELTMAASPIGWGTTQPVPGGPYTYYLNEIVDISAQAYGGYEFHHWEVSGGAEPYDPNAATTTVLMDQSKIVTAVFVEESYVEPEFRGFWADAFHLGFKSQADIDDMIIRALAGNYNAIVPEVLAYQDTGGSGHGAYWDSAIVPKASDIVGQFDPLEYLVAEAHAVGLEVHPWLVAFRVSTSWPPSGNATLTAHPEWLMVLQGDMGGGPGTVDGKYTLDAGSPDAQEYLMSIVRELVENYEIDGIHWDYIRYTNPAAGYPAYTWYANSGLERFQTITGYSGTPATDYEPWSDFRRRGVTEVVRRTQTEVASNTSNPRQPLRFSAALITWGDAPSNFENTSAWARFQNWREWMEEGYLDTAIPMTYYDYDTYPSWYRNWVNQEMLWRYDRHMVVGPGIYLNDFADSAYEIQYAQNADADGICTYSYAATCDGGADWSWYTYTAATVFPEPVPTPPMSWRNPATTTEGNIYGRVTDGATGAPIDDATVKVNGFPLVQTDGNGCFLITQLSVAAEGSQAPVSASFPGYSDALRPAVLIERAGYTEANFALGTWLPGDYDVDADVDFDDFSIFVPSLTGPDNGPPPAGGDLFDFDLDNDVDLADFSVFQEAFGI
ncbi:MAG: family 10 glycosylhydrolase [Planctomycetes bacterium]|nr:family 10 glycosylhydrolase [Planctomycetota bacterium]